MQQLLTRSRRRPAAAIHSTQRWRKLPQSTGRVPEGPRWCEPSARGGFGRGRSPRTEAQSKAGESHALGARSADIVRSTASVNSSSQQPTAACLRRGTQARTGHDAPAGWWAPHAGKMGRTCRLSCWKRRPTTKGCRGADERIPARWAPRPRMGVALLARQLHGNAALAPLGRRPVQQ